MILFLVCITAALSISVVSAGLFGDDVKVENVEVYNYFAPNTPNNINSSNPEYELRFNFDLLPTKDITDVRAIWLHNVEITYKNHSITYKDPKIKYHKSYADNKEFDIAKSLLKGSRYIFFCELLEDSVPNRKDISHIKADVMINTGTQDNVVIGHIDSDVSIDTAKHVGINKGGMNTIDYL